MQVGTNELRIIVGQGKFTRVSVPFPLECGIEEPRALYVFAVKDQLLLLRSDEECDEVIIEAVITVSVNDE